MWDNPRQLNMLAGFLVGVTGLAIVLVALQLGLRSGLWPLREVTLRSGLEHTSREQIEAALQGRVTGNFFSVDLAEVRSSIEQLPWVRRASLRRVWPDRLELAVEEHVALARWGDGGLVNTFGERFAATSDVTLPRFAGPSRSEAEVALRYARFGEIVAPLGRRIDQLVLTPRFAWQLRLDNGVQLALGRDGDAAEERLRRFVQAVANGATRYDYVDLRYPNGFALRLRDPRG